MYPGHACWIFDDFANRADSCYGKEMRSLREWKVKVQTDIFETINEKESKIVSTYKSDHDKALQVLTDLTNDLAERALNETKEKLSRIKTNGRY
jgi:Mg/Co/Ni transporter MgtE